MKVWVASGLTPFAAVIVRLVVPVAVGVPDRVAVPLPLSVNVSPAGSVPVSVIAGVGEPVVVIATEPAWFSVKSAVDPLVMVGRGSRVHRDGERERGRAARGVGSRDRHRVATRRRLAGVPEMVPVPLPLSLNVSPDGSVPVSVIAGAGNRSW